MEEKAPYFDERLYAHGIDSVAWDNVGPGDHQPRTVILRFPVENARPVQLAERVMPNAEDSEYEAIVVSDDLEQRGIRNIRVEVSRHPFVEADIYITIEGEPEPLRVTKRY